MKLLSNLEVESEFKDLDISRYSTAFKVGHIFDQAKLANELVSIIERAVPLLDESIIYREINISERCTNNKEAKEVQDEIKAIESLLSDIKGVKK